MKAHVDVMPVYAEHEDTQTFVSLTATVQALADADPDALAVVDATGEWNRHDLVERSNTVANALLARGFERGDTVAVTASESKEYVALILGTLAAGGCFVPLSRSSTRDTLALMVRDSDARFLFSDVANYEQLAEVDVDHRILIDGSVAGWVELQEWIGDVSSTAPAVSPDRFDAFNIIYSSGTTGTPKGIVHDHQLRSDQISRFTAIGLTSESVTLLATPFYSNVTMTAMLPTLFNGGVIVLMNKFDTTRYLQLAEKYSATNTMLVPVQYQRLLADPDFDRYELSHFRTKFTAGAPLRESVISEIMTRWPGNLIAIYGTTEGGGGATLNCTEHPDKWNTIGRPSRGTLFHIIDEAGQVLPQGSVGELVGRGGTMMRGYYKRPDLTDALLWHDDEGTVYYRSGDMAKIDSGGFVHLLDRKKDMILSGGFNIYAEDLERVLLSHPDVADAAVIAVPSEAWGETPLGIVVLSAGATTTADEVKDWANDKVGRTQRLSAIEIRDVLTRNATGKLVKRDLRAPYWTA